MKHLKSVSLFLMMAISACTAAGDDVGIPLSIQEVTSTRVANGIIRIVLFNTEVEPKMYVELIKAPGRKLMHRQVVKSIKLGKELLDFEGSGSVFIENIKIDENQVLFDVIYEHEGRRGEIQAQCRILSEDSVLSEPDCRRIE